MKDLTINIWRHPPREQVIVDGDEISHDVVVRINFLDVSMDTKLSELFGTFAQTTVIPRARKE